MIKKNIFNVDKTEQIKVNQPRKRGISPVKDSDTEENDDVSVLDMQGSRFPYADTMYVKVDEDARGFEMQEANYDKYITPMFSDYTGRCKCPVCGEHYLHFDDPKVIDGKDDYKAKWVGRGDKLVIPMWCEQGHKFELCIGFHKGQLFPFLDNMEYIDL